MGCSPPPYVASPKVDPRLDLRGDTMHIRNRCRRAVGICSRKMGLFWPTRGSGDPGGRATQGVGRPRGSAEPKWHSPGPAFLWTTNRWALVLNRQQPIDLQVGRPGPWAPPPHPSHVSPPHRSPRSVLGGLATEGRRAARSSLLYI